MLEHRQDIIPDFADFQDVLAGPPDTFLRANRLRTSGAELAAALRGAGFEVDELPFSPHALRVRGLDLPGATLEHMLGLYHVQGATSMLSPLALDVHPGHRVLDLCAAPGSKATQICEMLGGRGFLLANDPYLDRLSILKHHLERLGHTTACISRKSGAAFPDGLTFDRVLVDAPCSGEGTRRLTRKAPRARRHAYTEDEVHRLHRLQRTLLRRAANLVVPGGLIVYSTCTYAPEENEAAVEEVLRARPDLQLEEVPDELGGEPGLTSYGAERFRPAMARTRRFYPHRGLNAAGFFIARLRRAADAEPPRADVAPAPETTPDHRAASLAERARSYMGERFGVDLAQLPDARAIAHGRTVWLVSPEMPPPPTLGRWQGQNPGLRLVRDRTSRLKPTTHGLIALGGRLTRGVVDVSPDDVQALLRGERNEHAAGADADALAGGYVAVRSAGRVVGCAFVRRDGLVGQVPKDLARRVQEALFVLGPRRPVVGDRRQEVGAATAGEAGSRERP
jgi:NOL1/NOP2/sun family putative RNA methylase